MNEPGSAREALIHGDGFTQLKDLVDGATAADWRSRVLALVDSASHDNDGILRLPNLLALDHTFIDAVTHPRLLAIAHELVGADAKLAAVSGRILLPGCQLGDLHVDYPYWAMDSGMPVEPALMMQVIWMLEPFTAENGGTWVAAGSQQWGTTLDEGRFKDSAQQAIGNAGDALISHGLLWHRTAVNQSTKPRVALLINYTQLTIQPMTPMGPFDDDFKARASPALRLLLDLDHGKSLKRRLTPKPK